MITNKTKIFFAALTMGLTLNANAQTDEERKLIVKDYNQDWLANFAKEQSEKYYKDLEIAKQKAQELGRPIEGVTKDGNKYSLVGLTDNGELKYYITYNNITPSSIQTSRVQHLHYGGSMNMNIEGQTMTVGIWDDGPVYAGHNSIGVSRVTQKDASNLTIGDHGTHVAGTMIANGNINSIKGIAPQANLWANDWNNDTAEMTQQAAQGLLVSNHSYGTDYAQAGFQNNAAVFGQYGNDARTLDQLLFNADKYSVVIAAGNARNGMWSPNSNPPQTVYFNTTKGGADLMHGDAVSKNAFVVAAINGIAEYTGANDAVMSEFSQWGPTDDFRIKPDISTKGVNVTSAGVENANAIVSNQGTSMAAPAVSGVFLLWQQYYKQQFPTRGNMRSATVKALMALTADEAGRYRNANSSSYITSQDGPDHRFGWGVINAHKGAEIIQNAKNSTMTGYKTRIIEGTLAQGETVDLEIVVTGNMPLKAALAWTDPAGTTKSGTDNPSPALVNDLDLRIIRPNGIEVLPWALNKDWSNIYAARVDNNVDPVEVVEYKGAASGIAGAGTYIVRVSHKGTLSGGSQKYSLIISGENTNVSVDEKVFENLSVFPNPTTDLLNIKADYASIANATVELYDISGKKILVDTNLFSNTDNATINISHLQHGMYILRLINNDKIQEVKVIKK